MTGTARTDTRRLTVSRSRSLSLITALAFASVVAGAAHSDAASVSISWNAPTTNADGTPLTDLGDYRIYMGTATPSCPGTSFHTVSSPTPTPPAAQTVSSVVTGLSAGTTYVVKITAVDTTGNESTCSPSASGVAQADFSVTPTTTTSFGSITTGTTVDRTFTVQNTSTTSITGGVSVGAPYSVVSGGSFSLTAGASQVVTVRFAPTAGGTFATNLSFTASGDTITRAVTGSATGAPVTLTLAKNGTGTGTVTSAPAGISCGSDCSETVTPGTAFTLTAAAAAGSTFTGWSGGSCSGTSTCAVTVNAATTVTATFNLTPVTLTVTKNGGGTGTVTSVPAGISCGSDCSETVAPGTAFTLTATGTGGSTFAGWSGACSGTSTCAVTVNAATTVTATFNPAPVGLTVTRSGSGTGSVTSAPAGISCGSDCSETVSPGTQFTLTATPAAGSTFAGWSGACTGTAGCTVTVNAATTVTATFNLIPVTLTVTKNGLGTGTVTSAPAGISCGSDCSESVTPGAQFTLTATAAAGSTFGGWGGACSGTGTCVVTVSAAIAVTATFNQTPVTLTVARNGNGTGTVTSTPAGISCGSDCSETVAPGTQFTLTAAPTAGATFAGWSGGGCSGTGTCVATVNTATTVTATFNLTPVTLTVAKSGTGTGTVSSAPAGVSCGSDCSESVTPGAQFTLTASAAAGSTFAGWSGACSGTGTCAVTVSAATTVTATFNLNPVTLTVTKSGTGAGTVTSAPAGISCGSDCSESVAPGTPFTLTATATAGSVFAGWSGACSGTGACAVTVNAATTVTATFNPAPVTLSVTTGGAGSGTVTSSPAGIACGADCSETVNPGTQFTLTAAPTGGSIFMGWGGACSGTAACVVTVNAATTVTASFDPPAPPSVLSVTTTGTGLGTVTGPTAGIACGTECAATVSSGTPITLTAAAAFGSTFKGWSGACSGTALTCAWTMNGATTVIATFESTRVDRPLQPAPAPIPSGVSPSSVTAGSASFTLTVSGRGFVGSSVVRWNGTARPTTFVSTRELRATITAADVVAPKTVPVNVVTPAPGGGISSPVSFTIAAAPTSPPPPVTPVTPVTPGIPTLPRDSDIIIDNAGPGVQDSVGGRTFTGTWCPALAPTKYGSSSLYACGSGIDTYRWTPQIPVSGIYDVYVWVAASPYLSRNVPFVVAHQGGTTRRTIDQRTGDGRWVLHGRYFFHAGTDGYVETSFDQANGARGTAGADAVRFVRRR